MTVIVTYLRKECLPGPGPLLGPGVHMIPMLSQKEIVPCPSSHEGIKAPAEQSMLKATEPSVTEPA